MIPDDVVDRVRQEADIVAIVGEYVKLKRVGNSFRGPCPFHHGKGPNFSVTSRGYNCFVCHESGDVFTFVEKHLGLDFIEAVKWVGAKSGVEVREVSRQRDERDPREPLWEVNASAAEFFRSQLWTSDQSAGRDYVASRQLTQDDADRFGLGLAPRDAASMRKSLAALGFDDERQRAAGLLLSREGETEMRPRFRGRLMFPIYDIAGHVAGFGGRVLDAREPKYLNSAESELFAKRTLLYGLNWAKQSIRKADRLIIVEGYFDLIRLHLAGVQEVVAPLGTALTEQQAALIRKYTKNVFLLYDSDQAGLKATFRSGDELLRAGATVRVITLPEGDDPDSFVAKAGVEGFERAASASIDLFDRKIQLLERGAWFADLQRKRRAIDKLLPTIRATSDQLLRDLYISRTSEVAGISVEAVAREVDAAATRGAAAKERRKGDRADERQRPQTREIRRVAGPHAERELVRVLLHQRRYVEAAAERVDPDAFADPTYRAIFERLASLDPDAPIDELALALDDQAIEVMQQLLEENGGLDHAAETVDASINDFARRRIGARMTEIDRFLPLAGADEKDDLIREKRRLAAELQALGRPRWKSFTSSTPPAIPS
ncbi:MAG TPA: DNA primase [Gemmatimonadaceae bacterium]|nr:DNA primase [Gemmatimonadaceae bacterium]